MRKNNLVILVLDDYENIQPFNYQHKPLKLTFTNVFIQISPFILITLLDPGIINMLEQDKTMDYIDTNNYDKVFSKSQLYSQMKVKQEQSNIS